MTEAFALSTLGALAGVLMVAFAFVLLWCVMPWAINHNFWKKEG